jgi:hypothetical protein
MIFRIVFWDNYFTQQYIPEDNSEHHTRCRENLKSHLNDLSTKVRAFVYLLLPLEFPDNQFVYFILYIQSTVIIIVTASVVLCATRTVEHCLPRMSGT